MSGGAGRVAEAMRSADRACYLPRKQRRFVDQDQPLPLGHGVTCSQPSTVARMLEMLDVRPGDRVLDVGSGSGWTTAILGHLVGQQGWVIGVEVLAELVRASQKALAADGVENARVRAAIPGTLGWPDDAPYDRILVGAMATGLPRGLVDQLVDGGRMVVPVAGRMLTVDRVGDSERVATSGHYRFVDLQEP